MTECYISTWFIPVAARVAERLKDCELRELGNIRKVSQLHRMTALSAAPCQNKNFLVSSKKVPKNSY